LLDDSREADERAEQRRLRDLRGRVKAARAAISATPGAGEVLRQDWVKAARFYARFGITGEKFRHGVPASEDFSESDLLSSLTESPVDTRSDLRAHGEATLPA